MNDFLQAPWFSQLKACTACTARLDAKAPVAGRGPRDARVMLVGQNPGHEEDRDGLAFVGPSGKELHSWLREIGIDPHRIVITNIVKCHTAKNRVPVALEISTCRDTWLVPELGYYQKIEVLLLSGKVAQDAVLGKTAKGAKKFPPVSFWVTQVAMGERMLTVIPLPHPAYLLRAQSLREELSGKVLPYVRSYLRERMPDVWDASRDADGEGDR